MSSTPKYAGSSIAQQLRELARDAAYDRKPLDLLAAADEVGRPLSRDERKTMRANYEAAQSEMRQNDDSILQEIFEIREQVDREWREIQRGCGLCGHPSPCPCDERYNDSMYDDGFGVQYMGDE